MSKLKLPITLVCVDTTRKAHLAAQAMAHCLKLADFQSVKLLTTDLTLPYAVAIPPINGMEAYSHFMVRELHRYIDTSHALICQWDGFALNPNAWTDDYLSTDWVGAPWPQWKMVGNGGFSLRSKRLMQYTSTLATNELPHPEDYWTCQKHRDKIEAAGFKFAPLPLAARFSFEGRAWDGEGWKGVEVKWMGQFGFHSYLSVLPAGSYRPRIFHHSGDVGDIIYSLAAAKAMGGGMYFLSDDCKYPFPQPPRMARERQVLNQTKNLAPFLEVQPYIWHCAYTHGTPFSTDIDFNAFREFYKTSNPNCWASLFALQQHRFGVYWPENKPWLVVDRVVEPERPIVINRTERFINDKFPWNELIDRYGEQMVFVGSEAEYRMIQARAAQFGRNILYHPTKDVLELARVIAGAKVFVGNQSTPLAIAHGLGKRAIVEEWLANANCHLERDGALYWTSGRLDIPKDWLK